MSGNWSKIIPDLNPFITDWQRNGHSVESSISGIFRRNDRSVEKNVGVVRKMVAEAVEEKSVYVTEEKPENILGLLLVQKPGKDRLCINAKPVNVGMPDRKFKF